MTMKHTPGPWTATGGYAPTVKAGDTLLCVPSARADSIGGRQLDELQANAHLIAACPTMYEFIAQKAREGDERAKEIIAAIG